MNPDLLPEVLISADDVRQTVRDLHAERAAGGYVLRMQLMLGPSHDLSRAAMDEYDRLVEGASHV